MANDRAAPVRDATGGISPLAKARAVYRAWLATAYKALSP